MMTDTGTHEQEKNKGVQHSKTHASALSLRRVGDRTLHHSADRLSVDQIDLFSRMRDDGTKICVTRDLGLQANDAGSLNGFLSAHLARGREISRSATNFTKMPRLARTVALRSIVGGHVELIASHADDIHHFYGLSEHGLSTLAKHQKSKRPAPSRPTPPVE